MSESTHGSGYVKGCQCEKCEQRRARARRYAKTYRHPNAAYRREYKSAKQNEYDSQNREQVNERARTRYRKWREENPLPLKTSAPSRPPRQRIRIRHGGPSEWARMYDEQQGLCYLCLRPLPDDRSKVHVDHDHTCCDPGPKGRNTDSCRDCRRGLAHERCNQVWGLAAEDPGLLRAIASNGERVGAETRARIAAKTWEPLVLL